MDNINQIINNNKLNQILKNFIDVLRINIFLINTQGHTILVPKTDYFGSKILASSSVGINKKENILFKFKKEGDYLRYQDSFDLEYFAIPINSENTQIAYMIIGPVILNKKLEKLEYEKRAKNCKINIDEFSEFIDELRVVSFINLKTILDLLSEVSKYTVQINLKNQKLNIKRQHGTILTKTITDLAKDINESIDLDELLVPLLEMSLAMTQTECGSIMIINPETKELTIRVSRGIPEERILHTKQKVGEGIAGIAASENITFFISNQQENNRIDHLLKRPEIKTSIILPIQNQSKQTMGVLNLHTKKENIRLAENKDDVIRKLNNLTTAAIQGIHFPKTSLRNQSQQELPFPIK